MSAVTEMLDSALMAAVAWALCFGLPLCAAISFSAAMIAQSVSEYAAMSTDLVADLISERSIC